MSKYVFFEINILMETLTGFWGFGVLGFWV